jgi:ATP-dependent DNA ligase
MLRMSTWGVSRFIEPCLPCRAERPPAGPDWIPEIKHDGFRIIARRDGAGVRLITRHGSDFTARFPLAAAAVAALPAHSFVIDGEAIVTNAKGLAVFDLIRHERHGADAVLIADEPAANPTPMTTRATKTPRLNNAQPKRARH